MVGLPESRKKPRGAAGVQVGHEACQQRVLGLGHFVAGPGALGVAVLPLLRAGEVGQDEFRVDDLDVAYGVN